MPSLEEKFQRLLSIRAQILELVAEADTLVPQGGYLILSDLSELHAGLSAAPVEAGDSGGAGSDGPAIGFDCDPGVATGLPRSSRPATALGRRW